MSTKHDAVMNEHEIRLFLQSSIGNQTLEPRPTSIVLGNIPVFRIERRMESELSCVVEMAPQFRLRMRCRFFHELPVFYRELPVFYRELRTGLPKTVSYPGNPGSPGGTWAVVFRREIASRRSPDPRRPKSAVMKAEPHQRQSPINWNAAQ